MNNHKSMADLLSSLIVSCRKRDLVMAQDIINDYNFEINFHYKFDKNWTPLIAAATYNAVDIAKLLLNNPKIDINLRLPFELKNGKISYCSALFNACRCESFDVIDLLIENKATVTLSDIYQIIYNYTGSFTLDPRITNYFDKLVKIASNNGVNIKEDHSLLSKSQNRFELLKIMMNYYSFDEVIELSKQTDDSKKFKINPEIEFLLKKIYIQFNLK